MKSGDVKRGAGIDVLLIEPTETFESAWAKLLSEFKSSMDSALTSYRLAKAEYDKTRGTIGTSNWMPAWQKWSKAGMNLDSVRAQYTARAVELIRSSNPKTFKTDVNGHYEIGGIKSGKQHVFSYHKIFNNEIYWMITTDLKDGLNKLDLSNSNASWPFGS